MGLAADAIATAIIDLECCASFFFVCMTDDAFVKLSPQGMKKIIC